jgi:deoxyribonuclease-4
VSIRVLLGAHMSISGGVHTALERGRSIGCTTIQLFVKNNTRWVGKPLANEEIRTYKDLEAESGIRPIVTHGSYLINLCAKDSTILRKSRYAFLDELDRCERLGIPYFVFHPGAHMGRGEIDGIHRIAESLNLIHDVTANYHTMSVLETTAGQGSTIGYRFEHLRAIIDAVDIKSRMGICVDTCHLFAAGYDISTERSYESTFEEFNKIIGLNRLVVFHVNDSKRELGSRVDRHEHIGKGKIGIEAFRLLMNDTRFTPIPKILETPKSEDMHEDVMNMKKLRSLLGRKLRRKSP